MIVFRLGINLKSCNFLIFKYALIKIDVYLMDTLVFVEFILECFLNLFPKNSMFKCKGAVFISVNNY